MLRLGNFILTLSNLEGSGIPDNPWGALYNIPIVRLGGVWGSLETLCSETRDYCQIL